MDFEILVLLDSILDASIFSQGSTFTMLSGQSGADWLPGDGILFLNGGNYSIAIEERDQNHMQIALWLEKRRSPCQDVSGVDLSETIQGIP